MSTSGMCPKCGKPLAQPSGKCYFCETEPIKVQVEPSKKLEVEIETKKDYEDLEEENENLRTKLSAIAEKEFEKRKNALPRDLAEKVTRPEHLEFAEQIARERGSKPAPSGSAPLNPTVGGQIRPETQKGYDSYATMLADLRQKARKDNPNESEREWANQVLDRLVAKAHIKAQPSVMVLATPLKEALEHPEKAEWRAPTSKDLKEKEEKKQDRRDKE